MGGVEHDVNSCRSQLAEGISIWCRESANITICVDAINQAGMLL